jgi:hypothetical protein
METVLKNAQVSFRSAERIFLELKNEIGRAFTSLENGDYVDVSEVEAKWVAENT